jgi:anti-sigma factor (TIGR02949 family)
MTAPGTPGRPPDPAASHRAPHAGAGAERGGDGTQRGGAGAAPGVAGEEHDARGAGGDDGLCCGDVTARLWEYLDAELAPGSAARIEAHLARCQACHPAFDFQRAYRAFLRAQADCPVPPGLRSRVFRALLEQEAGRRL